ncbi:methylated-DNA--[protein]-cysteine S-methyltransferase [Bacillus sp. MRMR6]|uniref:methylated-DNA--[protein]-cysteine S-methyltransferase n=1 Tax=Bacillus sp. MRMR6 TaxID=1928617 RepID=UPI000951B4A1|nr:methylated-DNA--[protein]-cysteine S-methyltransferase [Bacillus sp. MRMR6]OLS38546.1 cysteine methyltransferase [Bacillus sp. MRMR6]
MKPSTIIYWTLLTHENWSIYIAATPKGLCFVGSQKESFKEMSDWAGKRYPNSQLIQDDAYLKSYTEEIIEYLQGARQSFTLPSDYKGTSFQEAVWRALCEIPYGSTCTYSDIATIIQKPASVRAVGTAIGANPILITVPCHRVIGKNGKLTGYRGGLEMKTALLDIEKAGSFIIR